MNGLQGETGHATAAERRAELLRMLLNLLDRMDEMDQWEQRFVTDMNDQLMLSLEWVPTPKQLFKARDINTKY